jgi:hypothetical protein
LFFSLSLLKDRLEWLPAMNLYTYRQPSIFVYFQPVT